MKLAARASALVFALFFTAVVTAQNAAPRLPQGITHVTTVEGITEYRLANGLQVLLFRDPSKATITVNMTYLVGSVDAGVTVFWIPIGLGYKAVARPTPAANCRIFASGSSLRVVEDSFAPFTLLVEPTGSIPTQVLSWMTEFIVFSIVAALTPLVTTFLKNINFTTLNVPSFSVRRTMAWM